MSTIRFVTVPAVLKYRQAIVEDLAQAKKELARAGGY
jgi:hypothetical protein